jgi:hypothetical protein
MMTTTTTSTAQTSMGQIPRYQALARCLGHIQSVRGEPRFAAALERSEERLERLMETAPSGSGFDAGTQVNEDRSDVLIFTTAFHHMDEAGFYDGWTEHTIRVKPSLAWGFDLKVSGRDRNGIKEYIADMFACWLNEEVGY